MSSLSLEQAPCYCCSQNRLRTNVSPEKEPRNFAVQSRHTRPTMPKEFRQHHHHFSESVKHITIASKSVNDTTITVKNLNLIILSLTNVYNLYFAPKNKHHNNVPTPSLSERMDAITSRSCRMYCTQYLVQNARTSKSFLERIYNIPKSVHCTFVNAK